MCAAQLHAVPATPVAALETTACGTSHPELWVMHAVQQPATAPPCPGVGCSSKFVATAAAADAAAFLVAQNTQPQAGSSSPAVDPEEMGWWHLRVNLSLDNRTPCGAKLRAQAPRDTCNTVIREAGQMGFGAVDATRAGPHQAKRLEGSTPSACTWKKRLRPPCQTLPRDLNSERKSKRLHVPQAWLGL